MAEIQKAIRVGDTWTNLIDSNTKEPKNYKLTTEYADGTPLTDVKVQSSEGLYVKKDGEYFIQALDFTKTRSFIVENIQALRNVSLKNLLLLRLGYYNKIETKGYYENGDGGGSSYKTILDPILPADNGFTNIVPNIDLGIYFTPFIVEPVNVKLAGARGDGTQDDSNYLQLAFDTFKRCYIPTGVYSISKPLILKKGAYINGDGLKNSIISKNTLTTSGLSDIVQPTGSPINYDVDAVIICLHDNGQYLENLALENLGLEHTVDVYNSMSTVQAENSFGIFNPFSNFCSFSNIETQRSGFGYYSYVLWMSTITNSYFRNNKIGGVRITGGTSLTIQSSWAAACTLFAWDVGASYSNMIGCGADFIGQFPQSDPTTNPADWIYRIGGGLNLINCGCEEAKGNLITINTPSTPDPSNIIGFKTVNYFANHSTIVTSAINATNNSNVNILGGNIRLSGATVTGRLVRCENSSYVNIDGTFFFPTISSANYIVSVNSALNYGDASGKIMVTAGSTFRQSVGYQSNRPLQLLANYNGGRFVLSQNAGSFNHSHIWHSAALPGRIMMKTGTGTNAVPTSDTDGVVLASCIDYGIDNDRPLNPPIGYSRFSTTLNKVIFHRGTNVWVDAAGTVV